MRRYRTASLLAASWVGPYATHASAQEVPSERPAANIDAAPDIVVVGRRGSAVTDIAPLAELDADAIAALGAQSVDEVNRAIQGQTRSADGSAPILLLNAQRVSGYQEIQSLPPEAIEKIEILPEPAALRYGFPPSRRVVNYITKRRFTQVEARTALGSTLPTGRSAINARTGYTRLRDDARLTANLDYTRSDPLYWSDRRLQPDPDVPFDALGNVTGTDGGEIDPALSTLAGGAVMIAPVPAEAGERGALAGYAAAANRPRLFDYGRTLTLAPANDTIKGEAVLGARVGTTLGGSLSLSLEHSRDRSLAGPTSASLIVPPTSRYTPFAGPVVLNRFLTEAAPLRVLDGRTTLAVGATLRGALAGWQWDATVTLNQTVQSGVTDRSIDLSGAQAALAGGADPFAPLSSGLLARRLTDRTWQRTRTLAAKLVASDDPFRLPAGRATVTATLEGTRLSAASALRGVDTFDLRLGRDQAEAGLALNLPLASRANNVLAPIGDVSANASVNVRQVEGFGTLFDSTFGLAWTPLRGLQLIGSLRRSRAAPDLVQLSAPPRTLENVPLFDLASGRTEVVTLSRSGNPALLADRRQVRSLSLTWKPWQNSELRVAASYEATLIRDQTGILVTLTPRAEALVPGLFVRDAGGRLRSVTYRPINFDLERQRKLQLTLTSTGRIGRPPSLSSDGATAPGDDRPSYYLGLVPTYAFEDRLRLREGAFFLDLLNGDTIGSYTPRVSGYAYAGVNKRGYGGTLGLYYGGERLIRGEDRLNDLRFRPIVQVALSAYVPVSSFLAGRDWAKHLQLRLEGANLLDSRQEVRNGSGATPSRYQTDLIDPLGRTVTVSLRKRF
ncbi:TonB-dependent receptor [Sphingomonas sp. RHCKR7]|uniref:TonB-dependent receptor n=1 Tax=Sphingomonas folli TaxID=2862497 RepID=UPI001CA481DD|nr:TonB-dependent receptor [Sphingomonas folli]MBW6527912.1 TonB-dependent receptor [Sphingomonas folli]